MFYLIGVCQPAHTRHDAENVVVGGIDADFGVATVDGCRGDGELEGCVIDTGHVARARRLVLFRFKTEGVHVDPGRRDVRVVLVRLDEIEVSSHAFGEAVVPVELEFGGDDRVEAGVERGLRNPDAEFTFAETVSRCSGHRGGIHGIGVVKPLFAFSAVGGRGVDVGIALNDPDKLLARVIEVELDFVGDVGNRFIARELELLDEVLVGDLGEAAALISVKVDVINVEGGGGELGGRDGTL